MTQALSILSHNMVDGAFRFYHSQALNINY
nr:MAG TPA: hypothetical protein [Caudoviricetes sp.]